MMWDGSFGGAGGWGWLGPLHWLIPLLFWPLIIAAVVILMRYAMDRRDALPPPGRGSSALDILEERYARGEIDREEFLRRKKDIAG